jgi:hypothetical protein
MGKKNKNKKRKVIQKKTLEKQKHNNIFLLFIYKSLFLILRNCLTCCQKWIFEKNKKQIMITIILFPISQDGHIVLLQV